MTEEVHREILFRINQGIYKDDFRSFEADCVAKADKREKSLFQYAVFQGWGPRTIISFLKDLHELE